MSLKDIFIILFFLLFVSFTKSQAQIAMTAGMAEGYVDEIVCIDVVITGFDEISSFEFGIAYDSLIIKPTNVNLNTVLFDPDEFNMVNSVLDHEIRFIGVINSSDPDVLDYSVPGGGGVLAEICFELIGEPGDMAFLDFSFTGNEISFVHDLGTDINFIYSYTTNSGKITILPEDNDIGLVVDICDESFDVTNDGSISFMATPGHSTNGPYNWEITDASGTPLASGTGLVGQLDNLVNGTYYVNITDSSSPAVVKTREVIVEISPPIMIAATINQPVCSGGKGSIVLTAVTGGLDKYNIKWESPENFLVKYGQTTLSNAVSGDYLLTLTNDKGCEYTETFTIQAPDPIRLENVVIKRDCYDSDANITADIVGGTIISPDEYRIDITFNETIFGGAENGFILDIDVEDITSSNGPVLVDSVYLKIRDTNGCSADTILYLPRPSEIKLEESSTVSCEGNQAKVIATGGAGNYTYTWSHDPNESSAMAINLPAGTSTVLVEDENECTSLASFYFDNPSTGIINFDVITSPVSCFGEIDGTAAITVDDESEWTINWYTDIALTNEISAIAGQFSADGFSSGIYYISAYNALLNCTIDREFVINTPAELMLSINFITGITCGDQTSGSIKVTGSGGNSSGTPNYTFNISSSAPSMTGESVTFSNLGIGDYTINIMDDSNCSLDTIITIGEESPITIDLDPLTTAVKSCNREFGAFGVNVTGGQAPYSFTWTRNGLFFSTTSENTLSELDSGIYTVSVTDDTGCRVKLDTALTIIDVETISFGIGYELPDCFGEKTCLSPTDIQGGTGSNYSIQVDYGNILPISDCVEVFAGTHTIIIIDGDNCASEPLDIVIEQPEEIIVDAGEDQKVNLGESSEEISVSIMSQNSIDQILWTPDFNLEYLTLDSQVVVSTPSDDIEYTVTVVDDEGCSASDVIFLDVNKSRRIPMANIFNPNGNGNNDFFTMQLPSSVTTVSSMQIYDRWGNTLYDETELIPTNGYIEGWDGKTDGDYVNPGVYVWMAQFEFIDGHTTVRSGSITVVR